MTAPAGQDRNSHAAEYLELLRSLAAEMEKAMRAIAHNSLRDLEESVTCQQTMSARLMVLAREIAPALRSGAGVSVAGIDNDLRLQVLSAGEVLQKLNRRYAALLEHAGRSVALMASLFSSYRGQFKEASGPRLKHQTWSCRM